MRHTSSKRHIRAFLIGTAFVGFIALLPTLISTVQRLTARREVMQEKTVLSNLAKLEDQLKEENIKRATEAEPPPPMKTTVKFTAPVITDEPIPEGEELKTMEELSNTKATISVADVQGTDDEKGVDIADLKDHQVV